MTCEVLCFPTVGEIVHSPMYGSHANSDRQVLGLAWAAVSLLLPPPSFCRLFSVPEVMYLPENAGSSPSGCKSPGGRSWKGNTKATGEGRWPDRLAFAWWLVGFLDSSRKAFRKAVQFCSRATRWPSAPHFVQEGHARAHPVLKVWCGVTSRIALVMFCLHDPGREQEILCTFTCL